MWIRNRPGLNKISILFTRHLASIQWKSFGLHRCLLIWKRTSWYCLKLVSFVFYYFKKKTLVVRFASFVSFSPPMYIGSTMLFILNSLRLPLLSYASCFDIIDSPFCTKADETYYYFFRFTRDARTSDGCSIMFFMIHNLNIVDKHACVALG